MDLESGITRNDYREFCDGCWTSLTSPDSVNLMFSPGLTRPIAELQDGAEKGCPCCTFLWKAIRSTSFNDDCSAVKIGAGLYDSEDRDSITDVDPDEESTLGLGFEIRMRSSKGSEYFRSWKAYFFEGEEEVSEYLVSFKSGVSFSSGSLLAQRVARQIESCKFEHECEWQENELPTRVIDVGSSRTSDLKLWASPGSEKGYYLALSYCWGVQQKFVTTLSNISILEAGFAITSLPRTIQDAVIITRQLGFRYLWVDALCIIQDSEVDKVKEITRMGSIYENAAFTIMAGSAARATEGVLDLHDTSPRCRVPFRLPDSEIKDFHWELRWHEDAKSALFAEDPLALRAWTLQERVMSKRTLCLSRGGVFWECDKHCAELRTREGCTTYQDPPLFNVFRDRWSPAYGSKDALNKAVAESWISLVEDYSKRSLSVPEDCLPALSGLAALFKRSFSPYVDYYAGLWEPELIRQLAWRRSFGRQAPGTVVGRLEGPSWSWASMPDSIEFLSISTVVASMTRCSVSLHDRSAPLSRVTEGMLELRAHLVHEVLLHMLDPQQCTWDQGVIPSSETSFSILCLGKDYAWLKGVCLILRPATNGSFYRMGVVTVTKVQMGQLWLDRVPEIVTII